MDKYQFAANRLRGTLPTTTKSDDTRFRDLETRRVMNTNINAAKTRDNAARRAMEKRTATARAKELALLTAKRAAARVEMTRAGHADLSDAAVDRYLAAVSQAEKRSSTINHANIRATENKLGSKSNGGQ